MAGGGGTAGAGVGWEEGRSLHVSSCADAKNGEGRFWKKELVDWRPKRGTHLEKWIRCASLPSRFTIQVLAVSSIFYLEEPGCHLVLHQSPTSDLKERIV